ncbi:MAG TPA: NRDE family protein [Geobacteraceae bacterium]|nr:NRDE family protein [Geobacteraceae bacterium]
MCLILLAFDAHPLFRLILAANRDEFFSRPAAPAAFRDDSPQILAGRDLKDGGTWLGLTRTGRIAAITNYRDPRSERKDAPSRGGLVSGFLRGSMSVDDYLAFLSREGTAYNGFNLIFGDMRRLCWFSNHSALPQFLEPGIHGLSNHLLDTPWPKVSHGKEALERLVAPGKNIESDALLAILAARTVVPDNLLPDTGVGIELERLLSPIFISAPTYGTRSSTIILIDREGEVTFIEKTYNGQPEETKSVTFQFRIADAEGKPSAAP